MFPNRTFLRATKVYAVLWALCLVDWIWFARADLPGWIDSLRLVLRWGVFGASVPLCVAWVVSSRREGRRQALRVRASAEAGQQPARSLPFTAFSASALFLAVWQFGVFAFDALGMEEARAQTATAGTWVSFVVGLCWVIWGLERLSARYDAARQVSDHVGVPSGVSPRRDLVWNPLDTSAWFYRLALADWFNPRRFRAILHELRTADPPSYGDDRRKLNQSVAGFCSYSVAFYLAFLLMTQVGGCSEVFELPAGGGEQAQIAQQVKVQKVIKKKYVINPFSAIKFKVPPIDDVKLQLTEITKHAYAVGYGEGAGAGYAGGTSKGKVRFVRLEYAGGDWNQDFGVGADQNMLIEYGIRTKQPVNGETESRTIAEIGAVPIGKGPSFVFMTGQRNISLAANEVKTLRTYLTEKHGFLFCDNGGSAHFHNQFFAMMNQVLPSVRPVQIPLDDVIHKIPYQIPFLPYVAPHGGRDAWGWKIDGRWVAYYHPGDIGDAWSDGHSGVKPEVWEACFQLGVNVMQYANAEYSKWLFAQQEKKK